MRSSIVLTLAVALVSSITAESWADPNRSAFIAVSVPDDAAGSRVGAAIAAAVEDQGWSVSLADTDETAEIADCALRDPTQCVPSRTLHVAATAVLFVHAEGSRGDDGEPRVLLRGRLIDRETGDVVGTSQRHCLRCREDEKLAKLAAELAAELIRTRESRLYPHTGLKVVARPANAVVSLGGVDVGPAGQVYRLSPGPHEVTIWRDGYEPSTHSVRLRPNQELVLEVELAPSGGLDAGSDLPPHAGSSRALPWLGIGAGAGAVALGTTLVVIHQGEVRNGKPQPTARNSRPWGVAAISVGVAAGAASGFWLWRQRAQDRSKTMSIGPAAGGGMIVWSGSF